MPGYEHPIVVAGTGLNAEVIASVIEGESMGTVVAFAVDRDHIKEPSMLGRPVIALEDMAALYPPSSHCVVNSIGYNHMNRVRGRVSSFCRESGYILPGFVHPSADLSADLKYGSNLIAMQGVVVEPCTKIGDDVVMWAGCYVGHHSVLGDRIYVGPRAAVGGTVTIGDNAFIGMNASVRSKIRIGARALVGAGSFVSQDLADGAVIVPARSVILDKTSDGFAYFH